MSLKTSSAITSGAMKSRTYFSFVAWSASTQPSRTSDVLHEQLCFCTIFVGNLPSQPGLMIVQGSKRMYNFWRFHDDFFLTSPMRAGWSWFLLTSKNVTASPILGD
jgi:hypothetical protein